MERVMTGNMEAQAQSAWTEKKWVWVADKDEGYLAANIISEEADNVTVQISANDSKRTVSVNDTEKMNPPKFDKAEDMADLTYLNEASVVHNLKLRYLSNLIYTYSGLFLVAVNPYKKLPLYTDDVVRSYKNKKRSEMPPHIFAISDMAYHDMLQDRENQSILITGESGAGKTENTKKVIQYLASIAGDFQNGKVLGSLEQKILQANPILEAFGNAQTIRNNNSSRFGKFIRIEFSPTGGITGANFERYLLEKSRVTHQTPTERNFHIFYQLLKGAGRHIKDPLLLDQTLNDYAFTKASNKNVDGLDDEADFKDVQNCFNIMGITEQEQMDYFRTIASVLHLGNLTVVSDRDDQAQLDEKGQKIAEKVCHVLGIPVADFAKSLLKPKVKAGREWVVQARNCEQVVYSIEALARAIYERMFSQLIDRINAAIYTPTASKGTFIGVLDIAGFEIFDHNSFEQLNINYTNEKLQQFFNHHMFILEQEEYRREGIEWKFIDFGLDLQPTIDLIEKSNPIGIFSALDEECVMPKATDKTFIEKLNSTWKGKSSKYEVPRFNQSFILTHYAGKVEYSVSGWLDKNKDPLNDNITRLLAGSSEKYIASLFSDCVGDGDDLLAAKRVGITKKGAFRTVAQRHKEQLTSLMNQLYSTEPHFVRCIIPNEDKKPGKLSIPLVLDQLRCNGVLEGIRIVRAGFPNRLAFQDFKQRYEVLAPAGVIPPGFMDGRQASQLLLEAIALDKSQYRLGSSKVFFKAGVLAQLEDRRDVILSKIVIKIQALARGFLVRLGYRRRMDHLRAIKIIQKNARIYVQLREWAWWRLYTKVKPLFSVNRADEELKKHQEAAREWEEKARLEEEERGRLEAERLRLEHEQKRMEELLNQEKLAAADQAEILARVQGRELDLKEQIQQLTAQLEDSESQAQDSSKQRAQLERQMMDAHEQLEAARLDIERLDKERSARDSRMKELERELAVEQERAATLGNDKRHLEAQLASLQNTLSASSAGEQELLRQIAKLKQQIGELEQRLEQETHDKEKLDTRRKQLEEEVRNLQQQLDDSDRARNETETQLRFRESTLQSTADELAKAQQEREATEKSRRETAQQLSQTEAELQTERSERERAQRSLKKTEDELTQVQQLIDEKGSEESKQAELRRIRDSEHADLKHQLQAAQTELDETKKRLQLATDRHSAELTAVQDDVAQQQRSKQQVERALADARAALEAAEESLATSDKSRRQLETDLQATKAELMSIDGSYAETRGQIVQLESRLMTALSRNEELQSSIERAERERFTKEREVQTIRDELEGEQRKATQAEGARKKVATELADMTARLEEETNAKLEIQKRLLAKNAELDALKDRFSRDVQGKLAETEEARKKAEAALQELQLRYDDADRQVLILEKTKQRLSSELEDAHLEAEREHTAVNSAQRQLKNVEAQLNSAVVQTESERMAREVAESNARKLQSHVDSLQKELEERAAQLQTASKNKADLEAELRHLIDEVGDGANKVELERQRRRLEGQIHELKVQLEEEEAARRTAEDSKAAVERDLAEFRKRYDADMLAKDNDKDELRRQLLREVNALGGQLEDAMSQRAELAKQKKKVEEQLEDLQSRAESTSKGQSDMEKAKKRGEQQVRELTLKLEEEERNRRNFEDASLRYEKKANQLQSEVERLESIQEAAERSRRNAEKRVEELMLELNGGEDSKTALTEARRRLEREVADLQARLEEECDLRLTAEQTRLNAQSELDRLRNSAQQGLDERLEKAEEARRILAAQQRHTQQELEDREKDLVAANQARKFAQNALDELRTQLEAETLAKADEASQSRKLAGEIKELQARLEAELARANEANEITNAYKAKHDAVLTKYESSEIARIRAEKAEAAGRLREAELEEAAAAAREAARIAEEHVRQHDLQIKERDDKHEEDMLEITKLRQDVSSLTDRLQVSRDNELRLESEGSEQFEKQRRKFQIDLQNLHQELDIERNQGLSLKESLQRVELELETLQGTHTVHLSTMTQLKRDKERMELRIEELNRVVQLAQQQAEDASRGQVALRTQISDLRSQLDESEAARQQLEKTKRATESRIDELNEQFEEMARQRADAQRSCMALDARTLELADQYEDSQDKARMAEERCRRAEQILQEVQLEVRKQRDLSTDLEREKISLDKQIKELQARIIDFESAQLTSGATATRRLEARIEELQTQIEAEARDKTEIAKNYRKSERQNRELALTIADKDKAAQRLQDDLDKSADKMKKMKVQLDELESETATYQLVKRRMERETEELRERSMRFEKEAEKLKRTLDRGLVMPTTV